MSTPSYQPQLDKLHNTLKEIKQKKKQITCTPKQGVARIYTSNEALRDQVNLTTKPYTTTGKHPAND